MRAVPAVRHAVKMQPSRHGDPDKATDDAAQGGGQELCRKAEREGYERADDEPDHGQPDGDAPECGRQRCGTDGQAGEEAEGGAEHHFMPMPCSVFISVRDADGGVDDRIEEHRARAFPSLSPKSK